MRKFLSRFWLAFILVFMYFPIITIIVFSFNKSGTMNSWGGWTFNWYRTIFDDPMLVRSIGVTLSIATLSAAISTIIGTMAAIGINEFKKFPKNIVTNLTYIPMVNADIVTGISLLLWFIFIGIERGYITLLLAHITFNTPYVIFSVLPKLKQMNPEIYDAALDLGAKPSTAIWKVVVPDVLPGIVTGFILAFTLSFDDFVISLFSTQNTVSNLSMYIYSMARKGIRPEINALSAIMFVPIIILLIVLNVRSSVVSKNKFSETKENEK